jgi:hypothetical protein
MPLARRDQRSVGMGAAHIANSFILRPFIVRVAVRLISNFVLAIASSSRSWRRGALRGCSRGRAAAPRQGGRR